MSQPRGVVTTMVSNWDSVPSAAVIDIVGGVEGKLSIATTRVFNRILAFERAGAAIVLRMAVKLVATTHSSASLVNANRYELNQNSYLHRSNPPGRRIEDSVFG